MLPMFYLKCFDSLVDVIVIILNSSFLIIAQLSYLFDLIKFNYPAFINFIFLLIIILSFSFRSQLTNFY